MLSSAASAQSLEVNFLARWMPSRHRAGVILNPSVDLASSLRDSWEPRDPNDSFVSHFAPLPASSSSSSSSSNMSVDSLSPGEMARPSEPRATGGTDALRIGSGARKREMDSMDKLDLQANGRPLAEKLHQERQQSIQEHLNGHQMEQLRCLLDEQQNLLRTVTQRGGADYAEWSRGGNISGEDSPLSQMGASVSPQTLSDSSPTSKLGPQLCATSPEQRSPMNNSDKILLGKARHLAVQPQNKEEETSNRTAGTESWKDIRTCEPYDDNNEEPEESAVLENQLSGLDKEVEQRDIVHSDDRPIKPGVGGIKKTFEELLEEQLRLEDQRLRTIQQERQQSATEEVKVNPKRTFLKRGEGLSRFIRGKTAPQKKEVPTSSVALSVSSPRGARCLPVQRKTTSLNRENRPEHLSVSRDLRSSENKGPGLPSLRSKMFGGRQRQNMPVAEWQRTKVNQIQQQLEKPEAPAGPQTRRLEPSMLLAAVHQAATEQPNKIQTQPPPAARQSPLEYSFELSFQEKLEHWDAERHKESMELGEFELLEQAAEELSFSSNSSFIMQVLQLDRQPKRGNQHFRRLSSTPIKSPGVTQLAKTRGGVAPCPKDGALQPGPMEMVNVIGGTYERKVLETTDEDATDASCQSSIVFGDPDDTTPQQQPSQPALPSNLCFAVPSVAQYDRTSYQDGGSSLAAPSQQECNNKDNTSFDEGTESTLVEDKQGNSEDRFVFDDDDTWNDVEEPEDIEDGEEEEEGDCNDLMERCPSDLDVWSDITPSGLKRKVATVKGMELESQGLKEAQQQSHNDKVDHSVEPPPTSQLVAKLFPSLKPKAAPATVPAVDPPTAMMEPDIGPHPQSKQLRERLAELEVEINRFRSENAVLTRLKQETEMGLEALRKEMADFERKKAEELTKLEEFRKEETRKLQRERRVFERHASAARALPDKKEREEIQTLKQQLSSLQEELQRREARWSNTHNRLRKQLDTLSAENTALREEVRVLEKLRLATWKKVASEKEKKGPISTQGAKKFGTARSKSVSPPGVVKTNSELPTSSRGSPTESTQPIRSKTSVTPHPVPTPAPKTVGQQASEPRGTDTTPSPMLLIAHPSGAEKLHVGERCDVEDEEKLHQDRESSQEEMVHQDGKIEKMLPCGARLIVFPNGTRKEVSADGQTASITFFNGDVKQIMADQRVIYYYADAQTTHTTYPDGIEVIQFPNNQIEKHFPDGQKEITFPDQTVKNLFPDGKEESIFPDGTIVEVQPDGTKVIRFNNGQREVHTNTFKRREYPDGTAKTIYCDGRQETRYPTGRVRIKDKDGHVIVDARN